MTSNAATRMFTYHAAEQGLGEDDEARYYYTAMSNTNTTNTNSNFVNEPYGGIHFYRSRQYITPTGPVDDEQWGVRLLSCSLPRHEQKPDAIGHDIWFKRLHLGEESPLDSTLYGRLYSKEILYGSKYSRILDTLPPIRPRPDIAQKILNAKNGTYPTELEHFLEFEYWFPQFGGLYGTAHTSEGMQRTQTFIGIKKVPTAKSPVTTDTFDIDIKRTANVTSDNSRTNQEYCFDKSEGGYYQIMRLSRTLAILLGIDSWEEQSYFPHCQWTTATPKPTNIKTGTNDKFYARFTDDATTTYHVLTIPPKWYVFQELADLINMWVISQWPDKFGNNSLVTKDPDPQWTECWFNIPPKFSVNFDDTTAPQNCRQLFNIASGVYTGQKKNGSVVNFITPDYPPYLERLTQFSQTTKLENEAAFMTKYLTQFMSQPTNIKPQGVNGAKLFVSKRSFFVQLLHRSYHPKTSEYKVASDNETKEFNVLPDYGAYMQATMDTVPSTIDGQYVDILICIRHPDAVAFSSTSYYDDPSKYRKIAYTDYVPVPIRASINSLYIPRGVPYIISEYLRDLMYLNHTVTILAPNMVYENAVAGKLDKTVECFQSRRPLDVYPWTKQWFQIKRPIMHVVRRDIFDNRLQFNVELAHGTSTTIRTLSQLSDAAKNYYANNSILMIGDHSPVALMFVFEK